MYVWHYKTLKKYDFDVQNKVPINWLLGLGPNLGIVRVRGIGLIHTELVSGLPAIFSHFVANLPAFHQVVVFLCIRSVLVPHLRLGERFLVGRVGPKGYRIYRCIARYGYHDVHKDDTEFEKDLICSIVEFIRSERQESITGRGETEENERMTVVGTCSSNSEGIRLWEDESESSGAQAKKKGKKKKVRFVVPESAIIEKEARREVEEVAAARDGGMAFIMGHSYVRAKRGSGLMKKIAMNYGYDFLRRNSRGHCYALNFPHASTLEVGMVYYV